MLFQKALTVSVVLACLSSPAFAADAPKTAKKKMEMDRPMSTTKMMKPGMKMGDVKKDADRRTREMKPKLDREEKSMHQDKPK